MNDEKKLADCSIRELAADVKIERETQYHGNTWCDWDNITFVDMALSKIERAWKCGTQVDPDNGILSNLMGLSESLKDGYNYLLELKRRLKERQNNDWGEHPMH